MATTQLTASEALRAINETVTGKALMDWNGYSQELIDELVILAQREGVEAAVTEIELIG